MQNNFSEHDYNYNIHDTIIEKVMYPSLNYPASMNNTIQLYYRTYQYQYAPNSMWYMCTTSNFTTNDESKPSYSRSYFWVSHNNYMYMNSSHVIYKPQAINL